MMRAAEPSGSYKKFLGSSFLSDFTLIICCESSVGEQSPAQYGSNTVQQAPEQEPGTPEKCLSPKSAAAAAAPASTGPAVASTDTHAAAAVDPPEGPDFSTAAAGDSPCSGQDHHGDHADILPQSPHRAAATAGVGPLSAVALQRSASQSLTQTTAADSAAAPAAQQPSKLRAITTSSAAADNSSASSNKAEAATPRSSSSPVIAMPVHGVVLAAASPYFETLLRGWACSHQPLHMVVGEEQLAAAQQLMSFVYTGSLQPSLPQPDLLQLLLLADRFDVGRAVAAARRALATLSPECFEWTTLTGVWSLPQHLFEGDGDEAAALRGVAWERLLQLFGDLEEAWASADGRAMWQQLPWRAVSALVASDALAVASENTTFAAVSSWIAHQQHQQVLLQQQTPGAMQQPRPSPQELQLLAASIRLPALGPCYMSYVCLQQDWFAAAVDVANLARAAAFAAAGPEVRKDLLDYTAAMTAAAMQAAAAVAAAPSRQGGGCGGSSGGGSNGSSETAAAAAAGGHDCVGSSLDAWGQIGVGGGFGKCSSCGGAQQQHCGSSSGMDAGGGSRAIEHRMQLMSLAQAMQRPRALSTKRAGQFSWRVDLASIRQLYDDVAAAGSRDSRILRSPAHSFAGYEWALQLEVTQTRGATGFDVSKPWSLGVFLTCQVRLEQPDSKKQQQQPLTGTAAAAAAAAAAPAAAAAAIIAQAAAAVTAVGGDTVAAGATRRLSSGSNGSSGLVAGGTSDSNSRVVQQQQQLVMQLVDFGFVSTSATIAVREAGGSKRMEKSWEHAVVRYRASWGWPNYLDAQAVGWDDGLFGRWLIDGQLHLSARVKVLG